MTAHKFAELEERIRHLERLAEKQAKELEIQFQRIAQIQAELDKRSAPASAGESAKLGAKRQKDQ
jgi:dihydroneopterin aldolase